MCFKEILRTVFTCWYFLPDMVCYLTFFIHRRHLAISERLMSFKAQQPWEY